VFADYEDAILLGEDVLDPYGGAFKVTKGLSTRYPNRVIATPISEASIVGCGIGLALRGFRPVVEIMFGDFLTLAMDQLVNHASKFELMYNGLVTVPLVVRTPVGGGRGYGPTHSQSLEKLLLGVPNLALIAPSHFHSPASEFRRAFLDDRPTVFLENKLLYPRTLETGRHGIVVTNLNPEGYGTMAVSNYEDSRPPDAVLITYGGTSRFVDELMPSLAEEEIRLQAFFVSEISSPPMDLLAEAVRRCGRVVIVEEGYEGFGWAAQVASDLYTRLFNLLKSPIQIVSAEGTVIPANFEAERLMLVSREKIESSIMEVLK
jgi:pyruvate/2-oxoglutarate/acetoin dehydrogenase E1 component